MMSTPKRTSPRLQQLKTEKGHNSSSSSSSSSSKIKKNTTSATKTNKRKASNGLSLYEIKRLENIARNKKVLASLGLSGAKRELSQAISTKKTSYCYIRCTTY